MKLIRILPSSVVSKIAAGEVVERPASVVKELVENSIDAGATEVAVYVKGDGIAQIKVVDDGIGIPQEDVLVAFQRHATSKISTAEDLFRIQTLGFRGEALYSISQVSKVRLITQYLDEPEGIEIYLIGGELRFQKPAVTRGTQIEVTDLFFNTPVRKKFLKSAVTEKSHIIDTMQNYCLGYPEVKFQLIIDGREILNTSKASSLNERIAQVFGHEFLKNIDYKTVSEGDYRIELFISKNYLNQKTKQLIFVNRRPVRDAFLTHCIYDFLGLKNQHPQFILFLNLPPQDVDFNIHPAKKEVKFRNQNLLRQLIGRMFYQPKAFPLNKNEVTPSKNVQSGLTQLNSQVSGFFQMKVSEREPARMWEILPFIKVAPGIVAIAQQEGLVLFDYHAAHERINFEKLLNRKTSSYELLFPYHVKVSPEVYAIIKENLTLFNDLGIGIEDFGENSFVIRRLPSVLTGVDVQGLLEEIATTLRQERGTQSIEDRKRKVAATCACHRSLRANDEITEIKLKQLLNELSHCTDPDHCPHGRPVKKVIPIGEIRKWLGR